MLGTLPFVFGLSFFQIEGNLDCPTPAVVAARVDALLGPSTKHQLHERAVLVSDGKTLNVALYSVDNQALATRQLAVTDDCEALASAVSVILATWIFDVHPEFVPELPSAPPPAAQPETAGAAFPAPAGSDAEDPNYPEPSSSRPSSSRPSSSRPSFSRPSSAAAASSPSTDSGRLARDARLQLPRPHTGRRLGVAAGVGASFAEGAPTILGALALSWIPVGSGLGITLSSTARGSRSLPLGSGAVEWSRWSLSLLPVFRVRLSRSSAFEVGAGPVLGWLRVQGLGFAPAFSHADLAPGAVLDLQLAMLTGWLEPFVAGSAEYSFKQAEAFTSPNADSVKLPSLELMLRAGLRFRKK